MNPSNSFASAIATNVDLEAAVSSTLARIHEQLPAGVDLLFAFYSGYEASELDLVLPGLYDAANAKTVMGSSGHAIIDGGREYEAARGLAMFACSLPNTEVVPMSLEYERSPDGGAITGWPDDLDPIWPDDSYLLAIGEPFSFPMDVLLARFNEDRPNVRIAGGMSAGYSTPGQGRIVVNKEVKDSGAAVVRLSGGVQIETIVSQGCRPIGDPMVITDAERNVIKSLGGKPALTQLKSIFAALPTRDQREMKKGLHVGRVINEYQDKFEYGDFLIRNVTSVDGVSGGIAVGDYMRTGQTVQFHIRDHESASAELEQLLSTRKGQSPTAALLFTCNGRGTNLFPDENHDAGLVNKVVGELPISGFFAGGEIGPVGGQNFFHSFTACVVLFC